MKNIIATLITACLLFPAAAGAQAYDPWSGYDARSIRELRDEASARRERLRELARQSYEQRSAESPYMGVSAPVRASDLTVASSSRPPRPSASAAMAEVPVSAPGIISSARPPKRGGPSWTGPTLSLTDADRLWVAAMFAPAAAPQAPALPEDAVIVETVYKDVVLTASPRPAPRPLPAWPTPGLDLTASGLFLAAMPADAPFAQRVRDPFQNVRFADSYAMLVPNLRALVNVSRQRVTLMEGDKVLAEWPVSTGRPGYETTRGKFKPTFLSRNHRSSQYNDAPMPCSVFFHKGEAFHGTTALGALGRKASHGCVRLETKNACALYDMVAERGKQALTVEVFD